MKLKMKLIDSERSIISVDKICFCNYCKSNDDKWVLIICFAGAAAYESKFFYDCLVDVQSDFEKISCVV